MTKAKESSTNFGKINTTQKYRLPFHTQACTTTVIAHKHLSMTTINRGVLKPIWSNRYLKDKKIKNVPSKQFQRIMKLPNASFPF
jgi:hypothetical protein